MADRLLVTVLGHQNSGKTKTWNTLFDSNVRTGKSERQLFLNKAQSVDIFLINGSPQERGKDIADILGDQTPRIVLCSAQYRDDVVEMYDHCRDNGYGIFVQWLNPGFGEQRYEDDLKVIDHLLGIGATVSIRDGNDHPGPRVQEVLQFIYGWASLRNLITTHFPDYK